MDLAERPGRYRLATRMHFDTRVLTATDGVVVFDLGLAESPAAATFAPYIVGCLNAAYDAGHKAALSRVEDLLVKPCDCGACVPLEKTDRDPAEFVGNERCNRPVNDAAAAMRGGGA